MKIFAVADEVDESTFGDRLDSLRPDLVVSCGDLPFDYLEYLASRVDVPVLYVPGNHDPAVGSPDRWSLQLPAPIAGPEGCDNVDGRIVEERGMRIAGLGGSLRYKDGPNQYTQAQMRWRALSLELRIRLKRARANRKVDIFITHAPPFGVSEAVDAAHVGFAAFNRIIRDLHPMLLVHGHVHPYGRARPDRIVGGTRIVNAVPSRLIEI